MRRFALLTLLLLAPVTATAQQSDTPVVPGMTLRVHLRPGLDTVIYQRSVTRNGQDSLAGTRTVVSRVINGSGRLPILEVVQRFPAGGGEIVDTAIGELNTLRAVAHTSHQPTRTMRFAFVENRADGTVTTRDSTGAVRQELGGPIFDSNVIDLVVAALPLREGFNAELPFFIYERGGRVPMPVAVQERATVAFGKLGPRDAWIATVGVPGAPATIWVDAKTHAVLRVRYDITSRGMSFTDERVTPLS